MRVIFVFALLLPFASEARVFSYGDSTSLGAFIRGTGGLVSVNQDAFAHSSGAGTTLTGASSLDYGGEFGFIFGLSKNFHLRFGAEILQPASVNSTGTSPAAVERFTLNSSIFVFNPNLVLEAVYSEIASMRFFMQAGVGYAMMNIANDYKMTAAGTAQLGGVTDYKETMSGSGISGIFGFGLEAPFTDNVTFMVDFGYRYMPVSSFKYTGDFNTILKPAGAHKGDDVLNQDGSKRAVNMSGVFGGLGFRFYFNYL